MASWRPGWWWLVGRGTGGQCIAASPSAAQTHTPHASLDSLGALLVRLAAHSGCARPATSAHAESDAGLGRPACLARCDVRRQTAGEVRGVRVSDGGRRCTGDARQRLWCLGAGRGLRRGERRACAARCERGQERTWPEAARRALESRCPLQRGALQRAGGPRPLRGGTAVRRARLDDARAGGTPGVLGAGGAPPTPRQRAKAWGGCCGLQGLQLA